MIKAKQLVALLVCLVSCHYITHRSAHIVVVSAVEVQPTAVASEKATTTQVSAISPTVESVEREENKSSPATTSSSGDDVDPAILPKQTSLFSKDAIDLSALAQMDCHLRNVDYCYAGLAGSAGKMLPETDAELEVRCDEMKAATACLAQYNQRCQSIKVLSALAPFASYQRSMDFAPKELGQAVLPEQIESTLLLNKESGSSTQPRIRMADVASLCEPEAKQTGSKQQPSQNYLLRQRLFALGKCINQRLPAMRPCIEDLKTAVQIFYEPTRQLPLKPTCCAIARFRQCALNKLDDICGLNSLDQLEQALSSSSVTSSMYKMVDQVCRQAAKLDSPYCAEVLPPSGLRAPQQRGRKASKLAKVLDLLSFAPAASSPTI